jgi:hypothetical protein
MWKTSSGPFLRRVRPAEHDANGGGGGRSRFGLPGSAYVHGDRGVTLVRKVRKFQSVPIRTGYAVMQCLASSFDKALFINESILQ